MHRATVCLSWLLVILAMLWVPRPKPGTACSRKPFPATPSSASATAPNASSGFTASTPGYRPIGARTVPGRLAALLRGQGTVIFGQACAAPAPTATAGTKPWSTRTAGASTNAWSPTAWPLSRRANAGSRPALPGATWKPRPARPARASGLPPATTSRGCSDTACANWPNAGAATSRISSTSATAAPPGLRSGQAGPSPGRKGNGQRQTPPAAKGLRPLESRFQGACVEAIEDTVNG